MPANPNGAKKRAAEARKASAAESKTNLALATGGYCATPSATNEESPSVDEDQPIILEEEVCPAGKHQGKTFKDVAEDAAFCTWVCKEPRRGWMGMLKTYLETELGFEVPEGPDGTPEKSAEEVEQEEKMAAARAKLLAKGKSKGQPKKRPEPAKDYSAPVLRIPFEPTQEWQELLPEHVCPKGCQFRMDVATGKNYARRL
eukprot:TRINITY_DN63149_c0_g1_i1.p1 TRINITY_DN63149_c0_g1~~TRINITY_DN63149_c0_g1_i1.p1  ORF type:complete len:210 (-),score=55.12 TRINITY_DN63149_c0_g1_i1:24-626(-)